MEAQRRVRHVQLYALLMNRPDGKFQVGVMVQQGCKIVMPIWKVIRQIAPVAVSREGIGAMSLLDIMEVSGSN